MTTTLYLDIATGVFADSGDAAEMAENRSFRGTVDLAYQAGWRDHEQTVIDRLSDAAKHQFEPPEVYP